MRQIQVMKLGTIGYKLGVEIQEKCKRKLLANIAQGKPTVGAMLLLQHSPVYTVGVRNKNYTAKDEERLRALGADFFVTDRGGLITFHGPGQLVAYPIINLKGYCQGMRDYICKLEKTLKNVCTHFGLQSRTIKEYNGVWIGEKKVAALGQFNKFIYFYYYYCYFFIF